MSFDDPNRQAVGLDPAWVEGTGGPAGEPGGPPPEPEQPEQPEQPEGEATDPLDDMTKDELIAEASARGIDVNQAMTKAEIRAAIDSG